MICTLCRAKYACSDNGVQDINSLMTFDMLMQTQLKARAAVRLPQADESLLERDERIGAVPQGRGLLQIRDVTIYPGWDGSLLAGQHDEVRPLHCSCIAVEHRICAQNIRLCMLYHRHKTVP